MSVLGNVINVMSLPVCHKISFRLADITIHGHDYRKVGLALQSHDIQLVYSVRKTNDHAEYDYEHDTLIVGASATADLLVHEATHAILDMRAKPEDRQNSEMVAYVAQYLFLTLRNHGLGRRSKQEVKTATTDAYQCIWDSSKCETAVGEAALLVAQSIFHKKHPHHADVERLKMAIANHPKYSSGEKTCSFDGLKPGSFFTAAELKAMQAQVVM